MKGEAMPSLKYCNKVVY